ncbi:hypothetical protein [Millisia brevis]|uniref:hypothetical protein n=1 Tax=Millisia brevis TaxID=264148 RepID=UPI000831BB6A|nr:hypothetical protein [Millisia brevis]
MIGFVAGLAAGYVLGTKAGRARYEQISRATKAVATSPVTRKAVHAGRQKVADVISTKPKLEPVRVVDRSADQDEDTTVLVPHDKL